MHYTYHIVDSDTTTSAKLIKALEIFPEFNLSGLSTGHSEGFNAITKRTPDLVFINLDQTVVASFDLVRELQLYLNEPPLVIALSKKTAKAYEAIKSNFFDYWLMPLSELEILKFSLVLKKRVPKDKEPQRICLQTYRDYHYVNTDEILYIKADNNATEVYMTDGSKLHAYKSLKKFEQQLPSNFIRVHQSYMLNSKYVARINYGKAVCSLRGQNRPLPFSKTYKHNVDQLKSKLSKNLIPEYG